VKAILGLLTAVVATAAATVLALKHVTWSLPLATPNSIDWLLLSDTDHDSLGEVIHNPSMCFQIAEYRPVNRYAQVLSDTGHYPWPESITLGNFHVYDIGDVDRDGLADIVGRAGYDSGGGMYEALCIFESRDSYSHPDSLVWWATSPELTATCPALCGDLDGDSSLDIVTPWGVESTAVFENVGDNHESLVCTARRSYVTSLPTIGDFDQNGRTEYTFEDRNGQQDAVVECMGDNRYAMVCSTYTGFLGAVSDRFSGHDVDRNGKPEYFEQVYRNLGGLRFAQTLCQFEATAEHQYYCDTVDTLLGIHGAFCGHSLCADVDGDSLEEIVWGCGNRLLILKATGSHEYERVCDYPYMGTNLSMCNAADFTRNGYKEIFVGGDPTSFVLEVECIRVLSPDTNHFLRSGDTCEIRWQVLSPPRCDSVSLFLLTDTIVPTGEWFWRLDTIATGIAPTESSYLWRVADTTIAWAKILAIAYGPGWQFDESDSAFSIVPSGIAEHSRVVVRDWALSVSPSPAIGRAVVTYDVPRRSAVSLGLYDASGRLSRMLANGEKPPGRYDVIIDHRAGLVAGVHFIRLESATGRLNRKLVVTEDDR
jgi:hypothetical protein